MFNCLVPLRGGSKSIPKKNIKLIAGKPLCYWVLSAAAGCSKISKVYVSSDCDEILAVVESLNLGIGLVKRPAQFATDEASTESVMAHFWGLHPSEHLVTIQATSPLLQSAHLDEAIASFLQNRYDSLLSAVRFKRFFWTDDFHPINYDPNQRPRRQDFRGTLMENGAFYISSDELFRTSHSRLGGKIGIYEMPPESAIEIDEQEDWQAVEKLLVGKGVLQ